MCPRPLAVEDVASRRRDRQPRLAGVDGRKTLTLAALTFAASTLAGCESGHGMMIGRQATPTSFRTNGERLYFTGVSGSGAPVTYVGGNMHLRMTGGGCATCHGADRGGTRMMPEFWVTAPALISEALFGSHQDHDGHGDHSSYDADSLRRATSQGVDSSGARLHEIMPRWSMSEQDWQDLIAYLRQS